MTSKTKARFTASAAGAVVLAAGLAGCGQSTAPPPATKSSAPVTITFWNEMTGPYETALAGEIQQFHKTHPNITVKDVVVPNDAALEPKLLSAVVGQNPPTISQMNPPWATGFIETGSLVNLSPLISGSQGFSLSSFYPNMLKPGKWPNGNQYLMPFNLGAAIMYYNKAAFQAAGIAHPPLPGRNSPRTA